MKRIAITFAMILPALPAAAQDVSRPIRTQATCAPVAERPSGNTPKVIGSTLTAPQTLYSAGQQIVVDKGTSDGVQVGQKYYVRANMTGFRSPSAANTNGWVTVVATTEETAIAMINVTCDGIRTGDRLVPFTEPVLPPGIDRTDATGELDFSRPSRVLFGDNGRTIVGDRDFAVADLKGGEGATPGSRFAIYRNLHIDKVPMVALGEAVVVSNHGETSLIRVTQVRDAIRPGEIVVPRRGGAGAAGSTPGGGGAADGPGAANSAQQGAASGEGNVSAPNTSASSRTPVRTIPFEDVYFDFDRYTP